MVKYISYSYPKDDLGLFCGCFRPPRAVLELEKSEQETTASAPLGILSSNHSCSTGEARYGSLGDTRAHCRVLAALDRYEQLLETRISNTTFSITRTNARAFCKRKSRWICALYLLRRPSVFFITSLGLAKSQDSNRIRKGGTSFPHLT